MLVVELPLALVAVMLYCVVLLKAVGVPQIVPLLVPKLLSLIHISEPTRPY